MTQRYMWVILEHKRLVAQYLQKATTALFQRAVEHDYSKFAAEEFEPFAANQESFATIPYGTEEYRAALRRVKPAIQHHYAANRHHPEHWANGVNDMDLLDVVEMVCDWIAASQRVPGDTLKLESLQERFKIEPQLLGIIEHTVTYLMEQSANSGPTG